MTHPRNLGVSKAAIATSGSDNPRCYSYPQEPIGYPDRGGRVIAIPLPFARFSRRAAATPPGCSGETSRGHA